MAVGLSEAARDLRALTGAEVEDALELLVDAFGAEMHARGHGDRLATDEPAGRVDAVVADVVERAAADLGPAPDVLRVADGEGEERTDDAQLPDRSGP